MRGVQEGDIFTCRGCGEKMPAAVAAEHQCRNFQEDFCAPAMTGLAVTQTPQATTASGCNRRICLEVHILGKWAFAKAWLRIGGDQYDGHYQLFNPRGSAWNSGPNRIWTHGNDWVPSKKSALAGKWCVIGWRYNGGHNYTNIGKPCVTVTLR